MNSSDQTLSQRLALAEIQLAHLLKVLTTEELIRIHKRFERLKMSGMCHWIAELIQERESAAAIHQKLREGHDSR